MGRRLSFCIPGFGSLPPDRRAHGIFPVHFPIVGNGEYRRVCRKLNDFHDLKDLRFKNHL